MNKKIFVLFLAVLLVLPSIMAVEVEMKETFMKGETFYAQISGNFLDKIGPEDIKFYRRHLNTEFEEINVLEINGDFHISVKIPFEKVADNYSFEISGVEYMVGAESSEKKIVGEFLILEEAADFSIYPVVFINESVTFDVQNLKSSKITLGFEGNISQENIELKSGEIKEINLIFNEEINYPKIVRVFSENQEQNLFVYLLENISKFVNIFDEEDDSVEENETDEDEENKIKDSSKTCSELGGIFCINKNETCEVDYRESLDGECCLGDCVLKPKTNLGKTLGWVLIVVVVIFLTWFFKERFKK